MPYYGRPTTPQWNLRIPSSGYSIDIDPLLAVWPPLAILVLQQDKTCTNITVFFKGLFPLSFNAIVMSAPSDLKWHLAMVASPMDFITREKLPEVDWQ